MVVSFVAAAATVGLPSRAAPSAAPADPELGPLISGETSYVGGTHVWTDYAYDDRGPNTNGLAGGDARYPAEGHPGNTADLIQVQLGTAPGGALRATAVLESLVDGHDALVGIGFDTDRNAATGAATLPGGGWTNSAPLGIERLLLLPTTGEGGVYAWDGSRLQQIATVAVAVDRARNVVSATADALKPGAATWSAVAAAGMLDDGGSWATGAHAIQDLAYVRAEDPTTEVVVALREQVPQLGFEPFQDKIQADVLAGRLPPSRAVAPVAFGTRTTDLAEPVAPGLNAFLYHSRLRLPEGVVQDPRQYNGVYQPYAVYLSANAGPRPPMVVFLHGANQYHNVNAVHFSPTGLVLAGAYHVPAVVIFPNGRTIGWGTPLAHQDALDATDDAIRRLHVDPDRVVLSGVSSGGYGTYELVARYPDRWAGGFSIVGGVESTGPLENLHNTPFRASNGLLDPLVNARTWRESADALAAAGTVDYRIVQVLNRSHDGPIAEGNCFYLELVNRRVDRAPARVRYTVLPSSFAVDPKIGLDQRPRGAFWVREVVSDDDAPASIDADSLMRDGRVQDGDDIQYVDENATHGADFCGEHPTMQNGNSWEVEARRFKVAPRAHSNTLDVTLTHVKSATIDPVGAGLSRSSPVTVKVTSDGPATLVLAGRGTIAVAQGTNTYTVS